MKKKIKTISELLKFVDERLDVETPEIRIGNITFQPSRVLKELDPIAYRQTVYDIAELEGIDPYDLEPDDDF
jgi:hypothetical protein